MKSELYHWSKDGKKENVDSDEANANIPHVVVSRASRNREREGGREKKKKASREKGKRVLFNK